MKHIEAMKLALEALQKCDSALAEELAAWDIDPPLHHVQEASNACGPAITAIREALAEQPAQEPCIKCKGLGYYDEGHECDDGSMDGGNYVECDKCKQPDFIKHEVENAYDWTEWVCPDPESYLMKCCDCGLVHEAQFRVAKYKPAPSDECEVVSDPDLQAQFRMRRSEQWSPEDTAHRAGGLPMAEQPAQQQEPVAWGWAIVHSDGTAARIRARAMAFFGATQERAPFTEEDVKQVDREWEGLAPHAIVTLYTSPPARSHDALISRLCNARMIAFDRLPKQDVEAIDDAIAALAEQQAAEPVTTVRSDAVNLARNMLEVRDCKGITPHGVRVLCEAVLQMDEKQAAEPVAHRHKWDKSGERCVKCGDKDWMGGTCTVPDTTPPAQPAQPAQQEPEVLGERCIDGGTCHHDCKDKCFRRECCSPLTGYTGSWAYTTPQQPAQQQEPVAWANPNDLKNFDMKVRTNGGPLHTVPLYTAPQSAHQQEPVAFGEALQGRVCGYTPGMSRVELQLPESTLIGGWLELGETVYIASVLGFNQHTTEAKLKEKNT